MSIIKQIKKVTREIYNKPNDVIDWNDWVFNKHNKVVAGWVLELAKTHTFDIEAVETAAYLHDIAYAWTSKNDPTLDQQSLSKARELLCSVGVENDRVDFIVSGIIEGHGMHEGQKEELSLEAKIFSTADALSHFANPDRVANDFYLVICWHHYLFEDKKLDDYKPWVLKKIDRDYNDKIYFDDSRELIRPYYEALKLIFSAK